jgi:hypothetical protein
LSARWQSRLASTAAAAVASSAAAAAAAAAGFARLFYVLPYVINSEPHVVQGMLYQSP